MRFSVSTGLSPPCLNETECLNETGRSGRRRINRTALVIASLVLISTWTTAESVRTVSQEAKPSQGRAFALLVCAACHGVASDQEAPPILHIPGPSFDAIANKPGTTAESLRAFISMIHAKIATATNMPNPQLADYLSFPKIISGRIGDAVQPRSEWRQWRQIVGLLDARAHLSVMPSACALDCNTPHRRKEFAAGASRRR